MPSALKTAVNSAITEFTVRSRKASLFAVLQECTCVLSFNRTVLHFLLQIKCEYDRSTLSAKGPLPVSVSPERAEIFHCTLGQMEGFSFLFLSRSRVWLVFTVKYCPLLQMCFRCAVQPSGVRLMMCFTFAGDLVTEPGCFRHWRVKLYFNRLQLLLLFMLLLMSIFSDYYRYAQNPSRARAVFMNANLHAEWMTPIKTSILSNFRGFHCH